MKTWISANVGAVIVAGSGLAAADCVDKYFAFGEDALVLADRTHVGAGYIGSDSYLEIGAYSQVHTRTRADQIYVRSNALLNGTAFTDSEVEKQQGAVVAGRTRSLSDAPTCEAPTVPIIHPSGSDIYVSGVVTLAPGNYGSVSVEVGATLVVQGGDYHISTLIFQPDTTLVSRWTGERTRLLVSDAVEFGDRHTQQSAKRPYGGAGATLEIISGQQTNLRIGTDSVVDARVVAPFASLIISSRTEVHSPIYGKAVVVEPDVTLGIYTDITLTTCGGE